MSDDENDERYSDNDSDNESEQEIYEKPKLVKQKSSIAKEDDDSDIDDADISDEEEDEEEEDEVLPGETGIEFPEDDDDDASDIPDESDDEVEYNEEEEQPKSSKKMPAKKKPKKELMILDDEEDDEEDEITENYLEKFDTQIVKNYIDEFHPECFHHNYDEIAKLAIVVKNSDGIIVDPLHRTCPYLTKYERARILGQRAKQIETGGKPFVKVPENIVEAYIIAELELKEKKIPFIIKRPIPGGACEYWNLKDLEVIAF